MANVSNVKSKFFGAVAATDADGISTSASISGAAALTINGTLASGGSYTSGDNIGQLVTITSAGDDEGITFTVVGTDAVGDAQTEVVTGADTAAATSSGYFNTVASITTSASSAAAVTAVQYQLFLDGKSVGTQAATTVPDDLEIGLNIMIAHKGTVANDFNVDYVQTVQQR